LPHYWVGFAHASACIFARVPSTLPKADARE
jgi:hypothetical protein